MLECDGYRMFHGTVHITPVTYPDGPRCMEPFDLTGTWLSKPGYEDEWWICKPDGYGFTKSFFKNVLSDFRDDEGDVIDG